MNPASLTNRRLPTRLLSASCLLLLCSNLLPRVVAADEPPARTTLSDPSIQFTVPAKPYVVLQRGPLQAVVVDNSAVDDAVLPGHRAGYHGLGSLTHARQPRNLIVPSYAGLNFEHIWGTDQVRFSQSPSGGEDGHPAWDFQWFSPLPKVGQRYQLVMRVLYVPLPTAPDEGVRREELRQTIQAKQFDASAVAPAPISPGPPGLAARYRGDAGIERDPHVLFAENFETGDLQAIAKRWGESSNKDGKVMVLSDEVPSASAGKRSLQMTATLGENTGGHLYTSFPPGAEKAYARFYVKFAPDADYIHHFVTLGGYYPPTAWPQGGAGERPRGDERFTVGIEPYGNYGRYPAPGAWNFYTYWHEMKGSADGKYWGNGLKPAQPALVPRDRWQCVEIMQQCNSAPDKSDGALALWLDGKPVAHFGPGAPRDRWTGMGFSLVNQGGEPFEGFRWRTDPRLKINFFWLLHYVTENAARQNHVAKPNPVNRVWFDDIVVSTEYIGPIQQ